ncbi:MAG: DUF2092 domain-containing protein [Caulobacteraceae bacterium]|nr:DUF2092 domain-containing protein [Caulobacteraceae bacterium]
MKIVPLIVAAAVGCGAAAAASSQATTNPAQATTKTAHATTKHASATTSAPAPSQVDPGAVAALTKMSAYLRTLPAFQITLQARRDDVDVYGQLITLNGEVVYKVRRPDALAVDLALPAMTRQYIYDGKTVTVFDPKTGYYGKIQAPPTIRETLELASDKYGVALPLVDLFTWSEGNDQTKALTSAHYIGKAQVDGQAANQYAFRQPGVDWQIWIADGDKPVPLRVALVARDDPARPKFEADLAWDTAPQFDQGAFAFTPPANAKSIQIVPLQP